MLRNRIAFLYAGASRWKLSWTEILFFVPTFFMATAFELCGEDFGKKGIALQLPAAFGSIPNFKPQLFPMEIYLGWVALLTLSQIKRWPHSQFWNRLTGLVMALLLFGALRALPDLRANPILVIRNCAFVWYLLLPMMIALYPIHSLRWEGFFQALYFVSFLYFLLCFLNPFLERNPTRIFWFIDLGLMFALAYGLTSSGKWTARLALGSIGFLFGLSYYSSIQRTTLLGLVLTITLLLASPILYGKFPRPRWRRIVWVGLGIFSSLVIESGMRAYETGGHPTTIDEHNAQNRHNNVEKNAQGIEKFRYYLWLDAWNQFRSSPLIGIGFLKPVVGRVYAGNGEFWENSGDYEYASLRQVGKSTPPISGPHNSYLNALARLGIFGAAFLLLHLTCVWLFLSRCYFASFFILIWQMVYAFFNVGLEGPIRSFPLLVLMGAGLKLAIENSQFRRENALVPPAHRKPRPSPGQKRKMGLVHVPYRFLGGEDRHVSELERSYRALGIEPVRIPAEHQLANPLLSAARGLTAGNPAEWDGLLKKHSFDFLHVNNIHATLGPAFLRWVVQKGIPTVMTVHNHRFYCTNGLALFGSEVCKACRPRASFLRPIVRNCNGSLPKSIYHSAALMETRGDELLHRAVTLFLAPSPYVARELQAAGIPVSRIRVFPHPVSLEEGGRAPFEAVDVAFVGRLSLEKGVTHLLEAARRMPERSFAIVGEGPLEDEVRELAEALPNVKFLGGRERGEALAVMRSAKVVCVPSVCHESFSLVAAEALSLGARLVVPDTQSFVHYNEAPFDADTANVTNPESLVYSLETALERPKRTAAEVAQLRERFELAGFRDRLNRVVSELAYE